MRKAQLVETLPAQRAAWEAALAVVPEARMTEPGAAGAWSVKDLMVQVVYYEQWYADRMAEALRGELFEPSALDQLPTEARHEWLYHLHQYRPLTDVRAEAHYSYRRLLRAVARQPEDLLLDAPTYGARPGPGCVWERLQGEVCERYGAQRTLIQAWLGGTGH